MSFRSLYDQAQQLSGKISTNWLRERAIELSSITKVKEQWSGILDTSSIRGFYVEGPIGPPVPLANNESMIVLARSLDRHMRRFVYTKELMHVFDLPNEIADTSEKFDIQAERLGDPSAALSPQFMAERKAFWRAVAVLCQEERRVAYLKALEDKRMSLEVISTSLQMPPRFARHLFRDDFPGILLHVLID